MQVLYNDIIALENAQQRENNGEGIPQVGDIITCLKDGQYSEAKILRVLDTCKTDNYPEVEKELQNIFGCKIHGIKNCKNILCCR